MILIFAGSISSLFEKPVDSRRRRPFNIAIMAGNPSFFDRATNTRMIHMDAPDASGTEFDVRSVRNAHSFETSNPSNTIMQAPGFFVMARHTEQEVPIAQTTLTN